MASTLTKSKQNLDTSYHDRRLARRLEEDPEFRAEFERSRREIQAIDEIVHALDGLREARGMSKAELARKVEKDPASIRRLLTARVNPELRTVIAMANALDAEVRVVPSPAAKRVLSRKQAIAGKQAVPA